MSQKIKEKEEIYETRWKTVKNDAQKLANDIKGLTKKKEKCNMFAFIFANANMQYQRLK